MNNYWLIVALFLALVGIITSAYCVGKTDQDLKRERDVANR